VPESLLRAIHIDNDRLKPDINTQIEIPSRVYLVVAVSPTTTLPHLIRGEERSRDSIGPNTRNIHLQPPQPVLIAADLWAARDIQREELAGLNEA